ncbi:odorant receptor 82a [Bactrocera dorsalis]|uniref:Odorant receptor n=1 Tax=Bactrocera dorsalis TaxID=27457 RepID=A0A6I9VDD5_BACDO|nr:odorant receptor 82a [Bactrocera dorsalis]XP_049303072.1 odorant receptor 82a [Bactrocera dorsalis]
MPEDLFRIQRNCLRVMGHQDIFDNNEASSSDEQKSKSKRQRRCFRHWQALKYVLLLLFMVSAQLPMMNYIIYHIDDLALATACLSIVFTNVLTVIKTSTFLTYKREFKSLMAEFESMYDELQEAGAKKCLVTVNVGAKRFVKLYFGACTSTGLYFTINPLVSMIWAKFQAKPIPLELPMPMRFPFDFESTPGYEFAYIYTVFITIVVVMHATSVDGLFVSFTTNLRGHFQALQYFIETNTFDKSEALLQRELGIYVQYHVRLLGLAQSVQRVFKPIIFGQFLMTSLQVCVIIYQLVMNMGVIMEMVVYCTFLSSILLQLLIYCYGAEFLKTESSAVSTAIQMSQWYNLPPRHRHVLRLMMLRSQREIIISAGFYEASLANFMSILKAAMSYITFIQSIE